MRTKNLALVEEALLEAGYAGRGRERKPKDARAKGRRAARGKPYRRFVSPAGWEVIVGKNAAGNDEMFKRVGRASDTWLHARGVSGSHVLLRRADGAPAGARPGSAGPGGGVRGLVQPRPDGFEARRRLLSLSRFAEAQERPPRPGPARRARDHPRRPGRREAPVRGVGGDQSRLMKERLTRLMKSVPTEEGGTVLLAGQESIGSRTLPLKLFEPFVSFPLHW